MTVHAKSNPRPFLLFWWSNEVSIYCLLYRSHGVERLALHHIHQISGLKSLLAFTKRAFVIDTGEISELFELMHCLILMSILWFMITFVVMLSLLNLGKVDPCAGSDRLMIYSNSVSSTISR